jgi:hypothetical protein
MQDLADQQPERWNARGVEMEIATIPPRRVCFDRGLPKAGLNATFGELARPSGIIPGLVEIGYPKGRKHLVMNTA